MAFYFWLPRKDRTVPYRSWLWAGRKGYRPASGKDYPGYINPCLQKWWPDGGLTLASENIGALLNEWWITGNRIITVSIPHPIFQLAYYLYCWRCFHILLFLPIRQNLPPDKSCRHLKDGIPLCCRAGTMDKNRCLRYVNAFAIVATGLYFGLSLIKVRAKKNAW